MKRAFDTIFPGKKCAGARGGSVTLHPDNYLRRSPDSIQIAHKARGFVMQQSKRHSLSYCGIDKKPDDLITNRLYGILRFYRRDGKVRQ